MKLLILVKRLGGKWDVSKKQWYIYSNADNKEEVLSHFPTLAGSLNIHGRSSSWRVYSVSEFRLFYLELFISYKQFMNLWKKN